MFHKKVGEDARFGLDESFDTIEEAPTENTYYIDDVSRASSESLGHTAEQDGEFQDQDQSRMASQLIFPCHSTDTFHYT